MGQKSGTRIPVRWLRNVILFILFVAAISAAAIYKAQAQTCAGRPCGNELVDRFRVYPQPIPVHPQVIYPVQPKYGWNGGGFGYQPSWQQQDWEWQQRQRVLQQKRAWEEERRWRQRQQEERYFYPPERQRWGYWNGQGAPPHATPISGRPTECRSYDPNYPLEAPEWGGAKPILPTCFGRNGVTGFFFNGRWWRFLS